LQNLPNVQCISNFKMFTDALYFYGIFVQTLGKFMAVNFGKSDKKNRKKTTDTYSLKRFQK
jgi:hypothetical protein